MAIVDNKTTDHIGGTATKTQTTTTSAAQARKQAQTAAKAQTTAATNPLNAVTQTKQTTAQAQTPATKPTVGAAVNTGYTAAMQEADRQAQYAAAEQSPATVAPTAAADPYGGLTEAEYLRLVQADAAARRQAQAAASAQGTAATNPSNDVTPTVYAAAEQSPAVVQQSSAAAQEAARQQQLAYEAQQRAQALAEQQAREQAAYEAQQRAAQQQAQTAARAQSIAGTNPSNDTSITPVAPPMGAGSILPNTETITPESPPMGAGSILPDPRLNQQAADMQAAIDYDRQQQAEYAAWLAKQPAYVPPKSESEPEPEPDNTSNLIPGAEPGTSPKPGASGTGTGAGGTTGTTGTGFSLTPEQIRELQERYMGVDPTGVWDENTISRANGESMEDWWRGYQASLAWDFGPGGNPSAEAREWAATNMPNDYARWLVQRGEAPNLTTAIQMTNNITSTPIIGGDSSTPISVGYGTGGIGVNAGGISPLDTHAPDMTPLLDQWRTAAQQQSQNQIDYATQQGIAELQRAEEDARPQFQAQRDQTAAAEARALDNQALYAERRGDRGGIGAAQYAEIQNNAAQAQLAVNQAQTKLSTDTARQIADLRAQGEFQKADQLLQIAQQYLSQLIELQQWQAQFNLGVDQFNKQLEQWNLEYAADVAALTGEFMGRPTLAALGSMAELGLTLAQSGIQPSAQQMAALKQLYGADEAMIMSMLQTARLGAGNGGYSLGSYTPSTGGEKPGGIQYTSNNLTQNEVVQLQNGQQNDTGLGTDVGTTGVGLGTSQPVDFTDASGRVLIDAAGRLLVPENQLSAHAQSALNAARTAMKADKNTGWATASRLLEDRARSGYLTNGEYAAILLILGLIS